MSVIYKPAAIPVKASQTKPGPDGKTKIGVKISEPLAPAAAEAAPAAAEAAPAAAEAAPESAPAPTDKPKKGKKA